MLDLHDEGTSWVWLISPILGLIVGPCVGYWSDTTNCKFGRRRPFLIGLCVIIIIGMTMLTFSPEIGKWDNAVGLGFAIVGCQLMDFALDTSETPSRAYTLDVIPDTNKRETAFNIQQFFVGVGGGLGYLVAGLFGFNGRVILFYVAAGFLIVCLILTCCSYPEKVQRRG